MATVCYGWQVRKLQYMEVFEHYAINLWSHCMAHSTVPGIA